MSVDGLAAHQLNSLPTLEYNVSMEPSPSVVIPYSTNIPADPNL